MTKKKGRNWSPVSPYTLPDTIGSKEISKGKASPFILPSKIGGKPTEAAPFTLPEKIGYRKGKK